MGQDQAMHTRSGWWPHAAGWDGEAWQDILDCGCGGTQQGSGLEGLSRGAQPRFRAAMSRGIQIRWCPALAAFPWLWLVLTNPMVRSSPDNPVSLPSFSLTQQQFSCLLLEGKGRAGSPGQPGSSHDTAHLPLSSLLCNSHGLVSVRVLLCSGSPPHTAPWLPDPTITH